MGPVAAIEMKARAYPRKLPLQKVKRKAANILDVPKPQRSDASPTFKPRSGDHPRHSSHNARFPQEVQHPFQGTNLKTISTLYTHNCQRSSTRQLSGLKLPTYFRYTCFSVFHSISTGKSPHPWFSRN